ncbi:PrsW family intramembrane metalloprotease [Streptomyces murinus]|uniref:PrsW family glutamic-type intramembrane protease n=1 Tax=Streptomyces murinus TaxID=33900 RepID=UPI000A1FF74C|nr:PrsW family glutamic-type intramembrane protease [Streptomyces murinus]WDO08286.1 PrsW family intramembrane metalloprotease [Streptomyces murinus]
MSHPPPPGTPKARIPHPQQPPPPYPRIGAGLWRRCLVGGLAVWVPAAGLALATRSAAALAVPVLLGAFLAPVVFVLWAYERHGRDLGVSAVLGCFLAGGALGVLGACLTAASAPHPSLGRYLTVALAEEAAKLGALAFALRRQPAVHGMRAGLVLGAAVGAGFAALESTGHALDAALWAPDPWGQLETELVRGLLAPLGPGAWTAVAGGVLLALRRPDGRFRYAPPVIAAGMGVALLHALADTARGLAPWLVVRLTGRGVESGLFAPGYPPQPSAAQQHLLTLVSALGPALVALAGLSWALSLARRNPPYPPWKNTP